MARQVRATPPCAESGACAGTIDEGLIGDTCSDGLGRCRREGVFVCIPEVAQLVCDGTE